MNLASEQSKRRDDAWKPSCSHRPRLAFTLAEVLITLGIIGVVAAMTIPTLLKSQQERATVTALKKAHSILSQAYRSVIQEHGIPAGWGIIDAKDAEIKLQEKLVPLLRSSRQCLPGEGCINLNEYKRLSGTAYQSAGNSDIYPLFFLNDGSIIWIEFWNYYAEGTSSLATHGLDKVTGAFSYDTNGEKGPNIFGKDVFQFMFTTTGLVIPRGVPANELGTSNNSKFSNGCQNATESSRIGYSCTAWVIYNENLDYLKCPGQLGWDGNKICP